MFDKSGRIRCNGTFTFLPMRKVVAVGIAIQ